MTTGLWLFAAAMMACVFQTQAIAATEMAALLRDAVFLAALVLVWREGGASRLFDVGILAFVAALFAQASNGTPFSAILAFVSLAMIIGGARIRDAPGAAAG